MSVSLVVSPEIKILPETVILSLFIVDVHLRFFLDFLKITKV